MGLSHLHAIKAQWELYNIYVLYYIVEFKKNLPF